MSAWGFIYHKPLTKPPTFDMSAAELHHYSPIYYDFHRNNSFILILSFESLISVSAK